MNSEMDLWGKSQEDYGFHLSRQNNVNKNFQKERTMYVFFWRRLLMIWIIDDAEKFPKKFEDVDFLDKKWTNIRVVINYMARMHPQRRWENSSHFTQGNFNIEEDCNGKLVFWLYFGN